MWPSRIKAEIMGTQKRYQHVDFTKVDWVSILPKHIDNSFLKIEGGRPSKKRGPCPICGGTDRYFFDNKNGTGASWCNMCGSINVLKLLTDGGGLTMSEAMTVASGGVANRELDIKAISVAEQKKADAATLARNEISRKRMNDLWTQSVPVSIGNEAGAYLLNRVPGLDLTKLGCSLRFNRSHMYWDEDSKKSNKSLGNYPTLVCKVKRSDCNPTTMHRTYLDHAGQKANVPSAKKLMRSPNKLAGAAIHLNKSTSRVLAVTEGVETGLAVLAANSYSINVWALVFAQNLSVADIPEGQFDEVVIYADHDKVDIFHKYRPGEHFAEILKSKLIAKGLKVRIVMPEIECEDFADLWSRGVKFELANTQD